MAKVIDPRALPNRTITVPGFKPAVSDLVPLDDSDPREVDEFNQMVRKLRNQNPAYSPDAVKPRQ
ncbi:MAG TPA: hypothetical protein VH157_06240 [Bryobacteraceae bacterium]|jgi:hypothetical protein|nr:hypothetical protein [Bryobacteraceae bacterium]